MITFKQFLIEYNAPPISISKTDAFFPAISGEGGGADVTVMNPSGSAFNSNTKPTLGMGFEMAPNLVGTVQKFVDKYSNTNTNNGNKATDPKTPATKTPVTWQTMNQAVSNQQREELNKLLSKYNLMPNEPNALALPPLKEKPPPLPEGGIPQRGRYPASSEETAEQFQARWAEYMRLRELHRRWERQERDREQREREERQRELDRQQRERDRNPNGQSPNFVQDPDFVEPPSPEPEIFGPPNPDSITPNGDGSYTLPDWWPHQWQRDPINPPEPEIFGPPNPDSITPNGDGSYTLPNWWPQQFAPPGQQQGNPGLLSMNNKPGSKSGVGLSPQERLTDKISELLANKGQLPQKALSNKAGVVPRPLGPTEFGPPIPYEGDYPFDTEGEEERFREEWHEWGDRQEREANDQGWQDWLARQSQEWLNQNPYPPRQPGMTDAEYEQAREAHHQRHLEYLRSLGYGPGGGGGGVGGGGLGQQTGNPGY